MTVEGFQDLLPTTPRLLRGAITYVAGTTGALGSTQLFTVTGDVLLITVAAKCTTDLTSAGAPTWTFGVTNQADILGAIIFPDVTGWDAGEWASNGGSYFTGAAANILAALPGPVGVSTNIYQTISTATITGGVVRWYLSYIPLSADGAVTLHANLISF